jgi:hypothetical protein
MTDLERRLRDLDPAAVFPPTPELAGPVLAAVAQGDHARQRRWRPHARAVALFVAATFTVAGTAAAASPDVRHALEDLLSLRGATIHRIDTLPDTPHGPNLRLGQRVTVEQATAEVGFAPLVPGLTSLGRPDAVYLQRRFPAPGGRLSIVYAPTPERPAERESGVALLLTEFQATSTPYLDKTASGATRVDRVRIGRGHGFWLSGAPHVQVYRDAHSIIRPDTLRLSGDVLVWERGPLTLRLECARSRADALRIARSMR